jgi:ferric-chelate reductase
MKGFDWGCNTTSNNAKAYDCRCRNINWIGSVTNCFESEGKDRSVIDHAYAHVRGRCISKAHLDIPVDVLKFYQENATEYLIEATDNDVVELVNHPLAVNQTQFEYPKRSFNHIYAQVIRSQAYQWGFVFFWTFVILVAAIYNFFRLFIIKYINSQKSKFTSNFTNKLRYNLTVSNLLATSRFNLFGFWPIQLPTRLESFVITAYFIYMVLASTTGYAIELPNQYQNTRTFQLMDLIGYRTGLNSFALIPPTFFFGIRNNPFIKLTGLNISSFMHFHKWCAYGVTIQALIHSAAWTHYVIVEGDYSVWAMDPYWQYGIAGTIITFLMTFQSSLIFREATYEFFLVLHKLLGIFFIVTMWYHCNTIGWMQWIYATIVIWAYDRILRFLLILWNGGVKVSKVTKLEQGLIRVIVPKPNEHNDYYYGGSYTYFYFLQGFRFYQSHPFSMMKSKRAGEENCYAIVFKSGKGITKKISQVMSNTEKQSRLMNVLTEGPYGQVITLNTHEQYVFLSAGIGFTPSYSQAVEIVEKNLEKTSGYKQHIRFCWIVRNIDYFDLFYEDMKYLIENDVLLDVYITNNDQLSEYIKSKPLLNSATVKFQCFNDERPSVEAIVNETNLQYSTTFISSGPSLFTDQTRSAVSTLIKDSTVRIDYYTESFSM